MGLDAELSKLISQLALKVLTPIMAFTIIIFLGTGNFIFRAAETSQTFNFDAAFWTWLIVFLAFTPLCGAIMWFQSVKAINGAKTNGKRKRSKPKVPTQQETTV
ncbi:hypothetical protein [Paenibacillus sp. PDC88]|uniref:hypothetical protein n=1 Tax=Paenibacillus sp. PDC88 TaxID=1884375 RepID=UPI00089BD4AD|nr:hypothetical protein [Paenibacillus sp. PDC88]SDW30106.1 hypothetical protein SAMN05518848_101932 [Paenibacillus sp. PDC88]